MPEFFPVYIFKGNEKYLKKEALDKLKRALLKKGSEALNFNIYDLGKCDPREILDTLRSAPFMSEKRIVVLRDIGSCSERDRGLIIDYAKKPYQKSCLIIDISKDELQDGFYANIRLYAKEVLFIPVKGDKLISWIRTELKKRAKLIRYEAAAMLTEIKEDSLDDLITEIDKLVSYVGGRSMITTEDIEKIIGGSVMRNVFELVDALSGKDAKKSLLVSSDLLKARKSVPEILGLIGWQLRRIKKAKELISKGAPEKAVYEKCRVPHYHAEKFLREVKLFTKKDIDEGMKSLLDVDYGIKTGHLKPKDALEILIIKICAAKRPNST